jgi:hypothetical protein
MLSLDLLKHVADHADRPTVIQMRTTSKEMRSAIKAPPENRHQISRRLGTEIASLERDVSRTCSRAMKRYLEDRQWRSYAACYLEDWYGGGNYHIFYRSNPSPTIDLVERSVVGRIVALLKEAASLTKRRGFARKAECIERKYFVTYSKER